MEVVKKKLTDDYGKEWQVFIFGTNKGSHEAISAKPNRYANFQVGGYKFLVFQTNA